MAPALQTSDPMTHQAAEPHPNEVELPYHNGVPGHPASVDYDGVPDASVDPAVVMRKLMKGKDKEWDAVAPSKSGKKLTLLELPVDILRLIIKEVS